MSKIIEFPKQNRIAEDQPSVPDYAGHILMLDLTKARKWQCFNFWLGIRCRMAVVPEHTSMELIDQAVQAGILLDITEHPELFVPDKAIADVVENDTGKKVYSGTRGFFRGLGLGDSVASDPSDETVSYATEDAAEQKLIEDARFQCPMPEASLRVYPVPTVGPFQYSKLDLPPGMDNPEKYLLPIPKDIL